MKREKIDETAAEIYRMIFSGKYSAYHKFSEAGPECKAFYRKIARWHLTKMGDVLKSQQIELFEDESNN